MSWTYGFFLFLLSLSVVVSSLLLYRLWHLRRQPGSRGLFMSILAAALWSFFYIFEIALPDLALKTLAAQLQFLGIAPISVGIFLFSLYYTGQRRVHPAWHFLLMAIPLAALALAFTYPRHDLLWTSVQLTDGQAYAPLQIGHGWAFWVFSTYSYVLLLLSALRVGRMALHPHRVYRSQAVLMLVGMLAPWAGNFLYITGLVRSVDFTPLMFTITNLAIMVALAHFGLLAVIPLAYSTIFNAMEDAVVVLDNQDRIVDVNRAAGLLFHPAGLSVGMDARAALPVLSGWLQGVDPSETCLKEVSQGEGDQASHYRMRAAPARGAFGLLTGRVLIFTDITAQKRSLRTLLLQATAMEAASNAIVITDVDGRIQWVNQAFTGLTGYTREEVEGQPTSLLKSGIHDEGYYRRLWETVQSGQVWHGVVVNRRKNGDLYHEEMSITPLLAEDGRIEHYIAIKQDVSQRLKAEEALKKAHDEALEASRMKTQLLANVSHELRTPLGAVIGYVQMLKAGYYGDLTADQLGVMDEMYTSSNQLLEFVNNLIGQAQLDTGKIVLNHQSFSPTMLADGARAAAVAHARRKGLELVTEISPEFPTQLTGDPFWLQQMIQNLVVNAVKFTETGVVKVCFYTPGPEQWAIEVSDTGMGIPPNAQSVIFEPFKQLDGSATRKYGGSGLGLSIVSELARLMNGAVHLRSAVGQGSTFTITLPILPALAAPEAPEAGQPFIPGGLQNVD